MDTRANSILEVDVEKLIGDIESRLSDEHLESPETLTVAEEKKSGIPGKSDVPNAAWPCLALRAPEAAEALGISTRTLWALTASRDVPHVRLGRAVLYPVKDLTEWLSERAKSEGRR